MHTCYEFIITTHKDEGRLSTVDRKILARLAKCYKSKAGIISFKEVFRTLSWLFHLNKQEAWSFLREMQEKGIIQIIPYKGIRICMEVPKDEQQR